MHKEKPYILTRSFSRMLKNLSNLKTKKEQFKYVD